MDSNPILKKMKEYGIGHRKLHDELFVGDKPPPRLVFQTPAPLCIPTVCNVTGCTFVADSLLEFENHYNACHRYACGQCKKMLPSPHLLDLHLQEKHDSFFAIMAAKKPSYCCYIEECKEKFKNPDERLDHCVKVHKLPKDFRFNQKPKTPKFKKKDINKTDLSMDVDLATIKPLENKKFLFNNSKQKAFSKNCKKSTVDNTNINSMNMDDEVPDIKDN